MATDLERLVVQLSAEIRGFDKALNRAMGLADKKTRAIENRFAKMNKKISASFTNSLKGGVAGIGTALSVREVAAYADAWTVGGNKVAAAAKIAGVKVRSLSELRIGADNARADFDTYVDLYAKLIRSASGVAKSEQEIATATDIVTKSFKAGGAATQEQISGILQLSQALGSGLLQGDELRSLRENAPLLAAAIAKEFKTTIAGLKDLGAEGKLTSDRVFKAILAAQSPIEAAFATTNTTIADSFTRLKNNVIEYVGVADSSNGASEQFSKAMAGLADNVGVVADAVVILASVLLARYAGGAIGAATAATSRLVAASLTYRATTVEAARSALAEAEARQVSAAAALQDAQATAAAATSKKAATKASKQLAAAELSLAAAKARVGAASTAANAAIASTGLAARTTAASMGLLRGVMGLVGGPAGAALLAAYAVYQFSSASAEASSSAKTYAAALDEVKQAADSVTPAVEGATKAIESKTVNALTGGIKEGVAAIEEAKRAAVDLFTQIIEHAPRRLISEEQLNSLNDLKRDLDSGKISAKDAEAALYAMANSNPQFQKLADQLSPLLQALQNSIAATGILQEKLAVLGAGDTGKAYRQYADSRIQGEEMVRLGKEYSAEAQRQNSLSKEQLAVEKEIATIKKDLASSGAILPDAEIRKLAAANLAADDYRRSEGKKTGGSSKTDSFEREVQQIQQRILAIQAETAAQAGLNPLINDYGFAVEKARAQQDLLNAAKEAGLTITPELEANIDKLATAYANAGVQAEQLAEKQDHVRQAAEEFKNMAADTTKGFIADLRSGKSAAEALKGALDRVIDSIINMAINSMFGLGGGGILSLFGLKDGGPVPSFARGGNVRGPGTGRSDSVLARLSNGEYVVNAKATKQHRALLERINNGQLPSFADGGAVSPIRTPTMPTIPAVNSRGSSSDLVTVVLQDDSGRMANIADQRIKTASGTIVQIAVSQANKSAPAAVGRHQAMRSGGDYRMG